MTAVANFVGGLMGTRIDSTLAPTDVAFASRQDWIDQDRAYLHYQRYYAGHHRDPRPLLTEPTAPATSLGAGDYKWQPRLNVMGRIVDAIVARLYLTGFVPDPPNGAITEALAGWWRTARMDETQNTLHAQTLVLGDGYLITRVTADGRPFWSYRAALHMQPVYDQADLSTMLACYETWSEWDYPDGQTIRRERRRLTIYRPDEITKWWAWAGDATWRPWMGDGDGGAIDWRDERGRPLGIPVHHFRNKPRGAAFGTSELDALIPLQDSLNIRAWEADKAAAYAGGPQRAIVDATISLDANGDPTVEYKAGPDQVWLIQSMSDTRRAQVTTLPAGDPDKLQELVERHMRVIGSVADIPAHLIWPEGGLPSGESLKVADTPLVAKCRDRSITWGDAHEDAQMMGVRLANRFGNAGLPDPGVFTLTAQWAPFETRSALSDAQVATLARPIVGDRESQRIMGYTDEEIDRIEAEKAAQPQPTPQRTGQVADGVAGT